MSKVEKTTSKIADLNNFEKQLPVIKAYMVESKKNSFFSSLLVSKKDKTKQSLVDSRESRNINQRGGLQKYSKKSSAKGIFEPVTKSVNSFKEIGLSMYDGMLARNEKKFDSSYDFANYLMFGLPGGAINSYNGLEARYEAIKDNGNVRDYLDYFSVGTSSMLEGAVNPEEPYSAEHWMSSFGVAGSVTGGGLLGKGLRNGGGFGKVTNSTNGNVGNGNILAGSVTGGGVAGNALRNNGHGRSPHVTKSPTIEKNSGIDVGKGTIKVTPNFDRKMEYVFGNTTGNKHNIDRSIAMERQLNSIGVFDNKTGRKRFLDNLTDTFNDASSILKTQDNGRIVRESILTGPNGVLKVESVWDGEKLITIKLFGGK
ncbi:hypothetical protein ACM26V_15665 [Salipaludibacillus sp. HK11]|uniref:hypothetical protein n=1 Tax=Salipaludibacillus sp. HK11 TaxID=3394320 RepID=UPI0039FD48D8